MSQTYHKLLCHFVFATKDRFPCIQADLAADLHPYMGGIIKRLGGIPIQIGGVEDHVHILAVTPVVMSISDFMRDVKAGSSKWIHESRQVAGRFEWQRGYSAFSVSRSEKDAITRYIATQREHHRQESSREELLRLLKENEVPHEVQYV